MELLYRPQCFIPGSSEGGYCDFPEFLWTPQRDGSNRKWISKTEYVRNSANWVRRREITARQTDMVIKLAGCETQEGTQSDASCVKKDIYYNLICIAQELGESYRVQMVGERSVLAVAAWPQFRTIKK